MPDISREAATRWRNTESFASHRTSAMMWLRLAEDVAFQMIEKGEIPASLVVAIAQTHAIMALPIERDLSG